MNGGRPWVGTTQPSLDDLAEGLRSLQGDASEPRLAELLDALEADDAPASWRAVAADLLEVAIGWAICKAWDVAQAVRGARS